MRSTGAVLIILVVLLAGAGLSQAPTSGLVGTWHNVAAPPLPQTLLIFSAEGYYIQLAIPPGRSRSAISRRAAVGSPRYMSTNRQQPRQRAARSRPSARPTDGTQRW